MFDQQGFNGTLAQITSMSFLMRGTSGQIFAPGELSISLANVD